MTDAPPATRPADPATMTAGVPPSSPAPQAMTAGTYLRLRREAAGLTVQHVVLMIVPPACRDADGDRAEWRNRIALAEADALVPAALPRLVDKLKGLFPFDESIFWLLVGRRADPEGPLPRICRGCACSWNDACDDRGQGCAWLPGEPTLCTVCHREGRGASSPAIAKEPEHVS